MTDLDPAWLLERVSMDVERLMRDGELSRSAVAARLREDGCAIDRQWIGELIEGRLAAEDVQLAGVYVALRKRS